MALANYLQQIKSSGLYRFVWDKSQLPEEAAETMRLVVGYSEKGPFNTPVYVENASDFKKIFGDINKKLERYGVYFHRLALQASQAGPILALNLKPFSDEAVQYLPCIDKDSPAEMTRALQIAVGNDPLYKYGDTSAFDFSGVETALAAVAENYKPIYDAEHNAYDGFNEKVVLVWNDTESKWEVFDNFFYKDGDNYISLKSNIEAAITETVGNDKWKTYLFYSAINKFSVEAEDTPVTSIYDTSRFWTLEPKNFEEIAADDYISISAADSDRVSNTIFFRRYKPSGYNITFKDWYATVMNGEELPSYLEGYEGEKLEDYFAEIYVFRGEFTEDIMKSDALKKYFNEDGTLKPTIKNAFDEDVDTLEAMSENSASNFINKYSGILLPDFVSANALNLSLENNFNYDNDAHKMVMRFNQNALYQGDVTVGQIKAFFDDNDIILRVTPIYLKGYEYQHSKPASGQNDDKRVWTNEIINAMKDYKGLRIGLTDRVSVDYHYLVDTFESFIENENKAVFTYIASKKDNALALVNFPAVETFKKFTVGSENVFVENNMVNFDIVANGKKGIVGTLKFYTLASEENGAAWACYCTSVVFQNSITGVKTTVPSAGLVSNAYMSKYITRQPYSIIAGPNYAKISAAGLVGPDYNFSQEDRDCLEPMGVNVLVFAPRKGTFINSQQTAKQNPVTALSKINVRELVIFLQDEIEKLLQDYQWEFNTQALRDKIKDKADVICETCKNNGGIYTYYNQCDEQNNTDEVISNEMLVLSTSIEPGMGAGKMVQELTIYRKGGMTSVIK